MIRRNFSLPFIKPGIGDVFGRLGYNPKKSKLDDRTLNLVKYEIDRALRLMKPAGISIDCAVSENVNETVMLDCGLGFHSRKLSLIMKNSLSATLMVCTVGPELAGEIAGLSSKGEMSSAVVLDAVASESVEAFAGYITDILAREKILMNLKPAMRFSPGYGDLKTDIQPLILKLLEADKIGVTCRQDSFILIPEKSITAIIGWDKK